MGTRGIADDEHRKPHILRLHQNGAQVLFEMPLQPDVCSNNFFEEEQSPPCVHLCDNATRIASEVLPDNEGRKPVGDKSVRNVKARTKALSKDGGTTGIVSELCMHISFDPVRVERSRKALVVKSPLCEALGIVHVELHGFGGLSKPA